MGSCYFDNYCFSIGGEIFNPPTNVTATVQNDYDVHVTWDPPVDGDPDSYNIWRNSVNIDNVAATVFEYDDIGLSTGTYTYCVSAVYPGGESVLECADPVNIVDPTPPGPTNLTGPASVTVGEDINLSWDAPGAGEWIHWDSGENNGSSVGLTNGGTFSVASHWAVEDLTPYNGLQLMQISFFPVDDLATYTLKVWTGTNGTNEVLSQDVTSFFAGEWNEITLDSPVTISSSEDFWFGYEATHNAGTFPAGNDDGPAIQGKGDMISTGGAWQSAYTLTGGDIDGNWNLQGFVALADGKVAEPMVKVVEIISTGSDFVACEPTGITKKFVPNTSKDLVGYRVYRKNPGSTFFVMIAEHTETEYTDVVTSSGDYNYYVTAWWVPEGESDPSNTILVDVITGIEEIIFNNTSIYPNPASDVVNIKSDFEIMSLRIYSHTGQIVADEVINSRMYQFDASQFNTGLYMFQIVTAEGTIIKRIIIE